MSTKPRLSILFDLKLLALMWLNWKDLRRRPEIRLCRNLVLIIACLEMLEILLCTYAAAALRLRMSLMGSIVWLG